MTQQPKTEKTPNRIRRACIAWMAVGVLLVAVCAIGLYLDTPGGEQLKEAMGLSVVQVTPTPKVETVALTQVSETPQFTPEPTPTPAPTATPEPTPEPSKHPENGDVLKVGMDEPIVLDVQIQLMVLEYMDFDQPQSEYSEGVQSAIESFQRRNELPITGECDSDTFVKLFSEEAKTYAVAEGDTGEEVAIIQERLIELGYLDEEAVADPTTAVFDSSTVEAVQRFRMKNNLETTDEIDSEAFELLLGENTVANYYGVGEKSDEIKSFQQKLYQLGYLCCMPDGVYGAMTQEAVRRFQDAHALVVDGYLGKTTAELLASNKAKSFTFKKGISGDDVKKIQQRLAHYGYMSSSSDTGYYGDVTEKAVKAFQSRNGLTQDGAVGYKTMAKLLSDNAKKAKTTSSGSGSSGSGSSGSGSSSGGGSDAPTSGSTIDYGEGIEAFIKIAESKLGCKYVRGAKGPNSFDCSGFVYWCLNQAGVNQSYMTSITWRSCTKYKRINSMSDLKRGDVLVFKGSSMSTGHVGIYLGGGKMIDAGSGKGKVVIRDSINTSYWTSHFLMAYRIWD